MRIGHAIALSALAVAFAGCGEGGGSPSVIQWIDGTGSAEGDSIALCTERARAATRLVAAEDGTTAIERLDSGTANAPTFRATRTFAVPPEIAADPVRVEKERDAEVDALYGQLAPVLDAPAHGHTEIVGALAASGRRLRDHDGPRYIHICSDLLDRRLLALDRLDEESVSKLIERMASTNDIPRLHGTKVVFDTTSALALDPIKPDEHAAIESFYRELVARGGGQVAAYGPGAQLPI